MVYSAVSVRHAETEIQTDMNADTGKRDRETKRQRDRETERQRD